jgi:hypothetical protein
MKPWDDIVLTEEETAAAIVEGKKAKYFREKHREYWDGLEKPKYVKEAKIKVGKLIVDRTPPKIFPE